MLILRMMDEEVKVYNMDYVVKTEAIPDFIGTGEYDDDGEEKLKLLGYFVVISFAFKDEFGRMETIRLGRYKTFEEAREVIKDLVDAYRHNEKVWTVMENKTK